MIKILKRKGKNIKKVYYIVFCAPTANILLMSFDGIKVKYGKTATKFEKLGDAIEQKRRSKKRVCVVYDSTGKWRK